MNTNVTDADGQVLGYYFECALSKTIQAVKANGERATVAKAFQARLWIEG